MLIWHLPALYFAILLVDIAASDIHAARKSRKSSHYCVNDREKHISFLL